ncbi:MAG: DUF4923 family protein [Prevotella sp.]|nr:DUF4923 family protein [Prevotella sp.]
MKKMKMMTVGLALLALTSCGGLSSGTGTGTQANGGNVLGSVFGAMTDGQTIGNVLSSVLGIDKPSESDIYGTWNYYNPGVAFTSDNMLAKAGGEVAAKTVKEKLGQTYSQFGFKRSNTRLVFNQDKTFTGLLGGKNISGTWTYEPNEQKIMLKTLLFSMPVYAKKSVSGMSFLMESKKLLTVLQTVAAMSGNSNLQTISDLSKNYDGVRIGFEMNR